ncbi:MAG: LemA family protein [Candidatus Micrarchaeia archaeon]|jgi:LemA protein
MIEWIIIGILAIVFIAFVLLYNGLVVLKARVDNAWSQIDVQLKRRADLIPNLVETVKGYAKHEKDVFENVTRARSALLSAQTVGEKARADNQITSALKSIFAVAENYPQLRASENFKSLQEELASTENKIAYARQFYNDSVMEFNQTIHTIPNNLVALILNYKDREYFQAQETEKAPVKIKF